MGWFSFVLGIVVGGLGALMWIFILDWKEDKDDLDSEEEYVDNTPTFR